MNTFLPGEDSSLARVQLEELALEISAINDKKRGWQTAWEVESRRLGDPNLEKPVELRVFNKQLGPLYGRREELLDRFPHLRAEYGSKKRPTLQKEHAPSRYSEAERKARAAHKKANHEANLARRREEDRARARGGTGGGGKKKG